MEQYVFYNKDISVNIYPQRSLSAEQIKQLAHEGYQKIDFEVKAADEAQAMDKFLAHFKENTEALKAYTRDVAFASLIFCGPGLIP